MAASLLPRKEIQNFFSPGVFSPPLCIFIKWFLNPEKSKTMDSSCYLGRGQSAPLEVKSSNLSFWIPDIHLWRIPE